MLVYQGRGLNFQAILVKDHLRDQMHVILYLGFANKWAGPENQVDWKYQHGSAAAPAQRLEVSGEHFHLRMTLQANQLSNLFPGTCCLLPESYDFFRREERKSSSQAPKANSISLEVLFETHDCTRKSNSILIQDYPPTKTAGTHTMSHTCSFPITHQLMFP